MPAFFTQEVALILGVFAIAALASLLFAIGRSRRRQSEGFVSKRWIMKHRSERPYEPA